jgi:hypothetical protein
MDHNIHDLVKMYVLNIKSLNTSKIYSFFLDFIL